MTTGISILGSLIHSAPASGLDALQLVANSFTGAPFILQTQWAREFSKRRYSIGDPTVYDLSSGLEALGFYYSQNVWGDTMASGLSGAGSSGINEIFLTDLQENILTGEDISRIIV